MFESLIADDFCTDVQDGKWQELLDKDSDYLVSWRLCIEPFFTCRSEERLFAILKAICAHDYVDPDLAENRNDHTLRVASRLLDHLVDAYRDEDNHSGIEMMKYAAEVGDADMAFFLEACTGIPVESVMGKLLHDSGTTEILVRFLDRRFYQKPTRRYYFDPSVLLPANLDNAYAVARHSMSLIYWEKEANDLESLVTRIVSTDRVEFFDLVLAAGFLRGNNRVNLLFHATRWGAPRTLKRLLELGHDATPGFTNTIEKLIKQGDSAACIEAVYSLIPTPHSTDHLLRTFDLALTRGERYNAGLCPTIATYMLPKVAPFLTADQFQRACRRSIVESAPLFFQAVIEHPLYPEPPSLAQFEEWAVEVFRARESRSLEIWAEYFYGKGVNISAALAKAIPRNDNASNKPLLEDAGPFCRGPVDEALAPLFYWVMSALGQGLAQPFFKVFQPLDTDGKFGEWLVRDTDMPSEFRIAQALTHGISLKTSVKCLVDRITDRLAGAHSLWRFLEYLSRDHNKDRVVPVYEELMAYTIELVKSHRESAKLLPGLLFALPND